MSLTDKNVLSLQEDLRVARYRADVVELMGLSSPETEGFSIAACETQLERVQVSYDDANAALLHAGAELLTPITRIIEFVEQNSRIRRMPREMTKAMHYLSELYAVAGVQVPEDPGTAADQGSD